MKEEFRVIEGFDDYEVSNLGRVRSNKCGKSRILKQSVEGSGYNYVGLMFGKKVKIKKVHKLVAVAFLNHTPNGHEMVVDHIDNNKSNNTLTNLQIITPRENSSKEKRGISKYTGVSWNKGVKKWHSYIQINGKRKHLGYFEYEIDAHNAYQIKLKEIKNEI